jgi:hypothetical protein
VVELGSSCLCILLNLKDLFFVSLHVHNPWLLFIRVSLASTFCTHVALLTKLQVRRKWCLATSTPPIPARVSSRPIRS